MSPEQISADWAAQRISVPSLFDVSLRLLGARRPAVRTYARRYRYPRLGIGQIFERCEATITELGGTVETGAEVIELDVRDRRIRGVRYRSKDGSTHEVSSSAVISTISLPHFARMLGAAPTAIERSLSRLRFRAIRLLNVLLEGPPVSPHTWMYVSEPDFMVARIQEPIHRSPHMAPPGCTSLMLEIPCQVGDATWTSSDRVLYDRVLEDLARLGFSDIRARTKDYFSTFVREGYPIYHLGYDDDRRRALEHVRTFDGACSIGRQGAFRYIFMDTAMEMGIAAARAILEGRDANATSEFALPPLLHEARAITA
jgi:protoporphyrinogen oxidase